MNIYSVANYFRLLLFPFSIVYRIIISLRNFLYDNDILFKYNSKTKVISIGNINTGGSGKTPLVIKFAELLLENGYKISIISRGYKRKTKGLQVVYDTKNVNMTVEEAGDEPYMIAELLKKKYNNFYLVVSENRIEAIKHIEKNFEPDYIILDDGYQNRMIRKDFDFLVIDINNFQKKKILNRILLPAGNLREPLKNIHRSTAIFQNNKFSKQETSNFIKKYNKPIYNINYNVLGIFNKDYELVNDKIENIIAFCGIADPLSFKETLKNFKIKNFFSYRDHKKYNTNDIEFLKSKYENGLSYITTEKDFVKIRNFNNFIDSYPVYFVRLSITIDKEDDVMNLILNKH